MGIGSVAVYSEIDRDAPHVREADEAFLLGPATPAESYLNVEKILEVAQDAGRRGDPPRLRLPGRERTLRRGLREGEAHLDRSAAEGDRGDGLEDRGAPDHAEGRRADRPRRRPSRSRTSRRRRSRRRRSATRSPQGGRGRRRQGLPRRRDGGGELEEAFEGAAREGEKFFSDPTVYLERYLEDPRHVEVQVLADSKGNVIHLGERDCSIQRRHQKLIEESPGPKVDDEMRERIGKIATDAAAAVGYRSAGTVEGLQVGDDYFFLEMNTRVQVEHCVTEMVTGHRHRPRAGAGSPPASSSRSPRRTSSSAATRSSAGSTPRPRTRTSPRRPGGSRPTASPRARACGWTPGVEARLRGHADVRPDGRQADRLGRRPRAGDGADAARARRVRDRRPHDADPLPPGAARHRSSGPTARPAAT